MDAMVAVNTATQSDPVMDKAHTHGDLQTKVTFQRKGRGTESPEMSGGLQNCKKIIERPPGEFLGWTWLYFLLSGKIDQLSKPTSLGQSG